MLIRLLFHHQDYQLTVHPQEIILEQKATPVHLALLHTTTNHPYIAQLYPLNTGVQVPIPYLVPYLGITRPLICQRACQSSIL